MTSPTMGRNSGGPCRHGVAVTDDRRPDAVERASMRPRREPAGLAAEPAGARTGGHDGGHTGEQRATRVVEVVGVVVVGEQDGVDGPTSATDIAGPPTLVDAVPHPNL